MVLKGEQRSYDCCVTFLCGVPTHYVEVQQVFGGAVRDYIVRSSRDKESRRLSCIQQLHTILIIGACERLASQCIAREVLILQTISLASFSVLLLVIVFEKGTVDAANKIAQETWKARIVPGAT